MMVPFVALRRGLLAAMPAILATSIGLALSWPALAADGLMAGLGPEHAGFALERAQQMSAALIWGQIPPRWMPDAAFGLGYPLWVYHGPLAWMLAALLALMGGGLVGGLKVSWLLLSSLAALGAWRLALRFWRRPAAGFVAAAAYAAAPYAVSAVYARPEDLSELAAYALAPWLLEAVWRGVTRPSIGNLVGLAGLSALTWTADLASGLMLLPLIGLVAGLGLSERAPEAEARPGPEARHRPLPAAGRPPLPLGWRRLPRAAQHGLARLEWRLWALRPSGRRAGLGLLAGGLLLGLLLAAWFLLPALFERGAVRPPALAFSALENGSFGALDWLDPGGLVRYGQDFPGAPPVRTGLLQLLVAGLGFAAAWRMGAEARRKALAWLLAVLVCGLAASRLTLSLWGLLPLVPAEWAPWRWLAPQALGLAMLAAPLAALEPAGAGRRSAFRGALLALAIALALGLGATWRAPRAALGIPPVGRPEIQAFETFSGSLGASQGAAWLPAAVAQPPAGGIDVVQGHEGSPRALPGFGTLERAIWTRREAARQDWQLVISPAGPTRLVFPTFGFPGWNVRVGDGPGRPTGALEGSGWLEAEVDPAACGPGGRCSLSLRLGRSGIRALAEGLSLLALIWLLALAAMDRRRHWGRPLLALLILLPALVLLARVLPTGADAGPMVLTSQAGAWPHRRPEGIRWGDARLQDATFRLQGEGGPSGRSLDVTAGDRLELLLDWAPGAAPLRVAAALVSAVEPREGLPDQLAWDEQALDADAPLVLILPSDAADGLYFVRLDLDDAAGEALPAFGAAGEALGSVYLGPLRLRGAPELVEVGETLAQMGDVSLLDLSTELRELGEQRWLRVSLTWRSNRALVQDHTTLLRLLDAGDAALVSEVEAMPLYGLLPSTAWRPDAAFVDRRWLPLPADFDPKAEYVIEVELRDGASGEPLGSARVEDLRFD